MARDEAPKSLPHWRRRLRVYGNILRLGARSLATDIRVFATHWKGGPVMRQRPMPGFDILVRTEEDLGRMLYYLGEFEGEESAFLRQSIRETDVCFDVGASLGYYTLLCGTLARRGSVHAFEPIPLNYHLLCANVLLNGLQNVTMNQVAVADSEADAAFTVARDSGYSSFVDTGRKPAWDTITVATTTLDAYCRRHSIERIDFLKVDVEGAEEKVLRGAAGILQGKDSRPRIVMLELNSGMQAKYGTTIQNVLDVMRQHSYEPFIYTRGKLTPFGPEHWDRFENVFFLQEST